MWLAGAALSRVFLSRDSKGGNFAPNVAVKAITMESILESQWQAMMIIVTHGSNTSKLRRHCMVVLLVLRLLMAASIQKIRCNTYTKFQPECLKLFLLDSMLLMFIGLLFNQERNSRTSLLEFHSRNSTDSDKKSNKDLLTSKASEESMVGACTWPLQLWTPMEGLQQSLHETDQIPLDKNTEPTTTTENSVPLVNIVPLVTLASLLIKIASRIEGIVDAVEELPDLDFVHEVP
ncbi:hypothetical protein FNV43_RR25312 [Rhamnella rubrinervis]|uniref:Uncharacterized protein n=1 Tax=Rhamnella rubrinervis TaxID=2594499 RepID=A0A8K0DUB5_9ROSA|nr:hypothetical protein FNV43_RR25312 [Rhamnella rubrinervis]